MSGPGGAPADAQFERLTAGVVDLIDEAGLRAKLVRSVKDGRPLTVKVGFDPTAPDIHLGHTVLMRKMREFQDLGHRVVYIVGDFTAAIGDPSGRSKTRPPLDRAAIDANARTYTEQAFKVLDEAKTETRRNSEWLDGLGTRGLIELGARYTVARMLERRDFRERLDAGVPVSIHELLYPLIQAYDSVVLEADVELGGTDQLFNLNVGRDIMPHHGLEPQVVMTVPLLEGTDGTNKMSKSLGNYVGIAEPPEEIFGKVMSISDTLMFRWYELLTDRGEAGAAELRSAVEAGREHPRALKVRLARELVARCHDDAAAAAAAERFEKVFAGHEVPDDVPVVRLRASGEPPTLLELLHETGLASSRGEARRLVRQGGVRLDGERADDETRAVERRGERLLQVGRRRFVAIRFE